VDAFERMSQPAEDRMADYIDETENFDLDTENQLTEELDIFGVEIVEQGDG